MPDTLRYSIQPSVLEPVGFVGDYGRLQVDIRPQLNSIIISAIEYDAIANALAEGRALNLNDEDGRFLGQFATGLAGGFDIATFTQAVKTDARISFKPSQELLASAREFMTFEQVPTVANDPQISNVSYTYDVAGVQTVITDTISTTDSGQLGIIGTNFVNGGTSVAVEQYIDLTGVTTTIKLTPGIIGTGAKHVEALLTATTLAGLILTAALAPGDTTNLKVGLIGKPGRFDMRDLGLI